MSYHFISIVFHFVSLLSYWYPFYVLIFVKCSVQFCLHCIIVVEDPLEKYICVCVRSERCHDVSRGAEQLSRRYHLLPADQRLLRLLSLPEGNANLTSTSTAPYTVNTTTNNSGCGDGLTMAKDMITRRWLQVVHCSDFYRNISLAYAYAALVILGNIGHLLTLGPKP